MPSHRNIGYFNSTFTVATSVNVGPFGSTDGWDVNMLTTIRSRGSLNVLLAGITTGSTFGGSWAWGAQYGAVGYTPADVVGGADDSGWFWNEGITDNPSGRIWSPDTDTAAEIRSYSLNREWHGQQLIGYNAQFYLSFALPWDDAYTYQVTGTFEALST
jgi:hypothetical protein